MADAFDEAEVERVVQLRKWIDRDIQWSSAEGFLRFQVPVECDEGYALRMIGVLTERTGYYRYNLLLGAQPARMLHVGKEHHNPDCTKIGRRHKHRWTDTHGQNFAYEPVDIDYSGLKRAFETFAAECGIELRSTFVVPAVQLRIWS